MRTKKVGLCSLLFISCLVVALNSANAANVAKIIVKPEFGGIALKTDAGATVYIDNKRVGVTTGYEFQIKNIATGKQSVKISKVGYYDYINNNVVVRTNQVTSLGKIWLQIIDGSINVKSIPSDALVYLDGNTQVKGHTPLLIQAVAPGYHKLILRKNGYFNREIAVTVTGNRTTDLGVVQLEMPGIVHISSTPVGATVFLNGENKGIAGGSSNPLIIRDMHPGAYRLKLTNDACCYPTSERPLVVTGGQTIAIDIGLSERELPSIHVESTPSGAIVFINDVYKGMTPLTVGQLALGTYKLKLTKCGFKDSEEVYEQKLGGNGGLLITLSPLTGTGTLWVGSVPPGATVSLSGKGMNNLTEMGKSSLFIGGVTIGGKYEVKVERRGFPASIQDYEQCQKNGGIFVDLRRPVTPASRPTGP